jgi:hypothetical protein
VGAVEGDAGEEGAAEEDEAEEDEAEGGAMGAAPGSRATCSLLSLFRFETMLDMARTDVQWTEPILAMRAALENSRTSYAIPGSRRRAAVLLAPEREQRHNTCFP